MLNLLVGGGDGRRRVFMVLSVHARILKDVGCCPGLLGSSVSSLSIFINTAVTCRMEIITNCHDRCYIKARRPRLSAVSKRSIF